MRRMAAPNSLKLFALLMSTGLALLLVHDFAYRRADVTGSGDYEFGGIISHAGADILVVTLIISAMAVLWTTRSTR
jgi:hypothetical protein